MPTTAEVKARLDDFLKDKTLSEADRLKMDALWPDEAAVIDPAELLDRLAASLAIVEPRAVEIVDALPAGRGAAAAAEVRTARRCGRSGDRARQPAAALRPLAGPASPGR